MDHILAFLYFVEIVIKKEKKRKEWSLKIKDYEECSFWSEIMNFIVGVGFYFTQVLYQKHYFVHME